jgi:serine/threonine protein kinase
VRPSQPSIEWLEIEAMPGESAAALLLPFLAGGDLVQLIGRRATRTGRLGPRLALDVGEQVGGILRQLLQQPRPIVHRDVKPQNVLLPRSGAPLTELTLIDFDISEELDFPLDELGTASSQVERDLVQDVHGFGELLFIVATGREPPTDAVPDPQTGNRDFDALVRTCLTSEAAGPGYVCLADNGLWHDLEKALATEKRRKVSPGPPGGPMRYLFDRRSLAGIGAVLFLGLLAALAWKAVIG